MTIQDLEDVGFEIETRNHALAVLNKDFPRPIGELCDILSRFKILDVELVRGGGGESSPTQRLRQALQSQGWNKHNFSIRKIVDGDEKASITHEIDHIRETARGKVALEIEWNNKDPFFDRDLENFQRLHAEGAISVGIVVTRGASLQGELRQIIMACAKKRMVESLIDAENEFGYNPTARQRRGISGLHGEDFLSAWVHKFVGDKFGTATTHWQKLQDRLDRGVGNPCPLLLIGIPASAVTRT